MMASGSGIGYEVAMTDSKSDAQANFYEFDQTPEADEQETRKSSEFAQMLEESFKKPRKKLSVGDKVHGEVLVIGKDEVFVSTGITGAGSDGIVPRRDLLDADGKVPYRVGDRIDLYVTQVRGSQIFLSPKATAKNLADDLEDAFDLMLPVEGRVVEVCKGGVRVQIHGKMAFCPISQLDLARVETGEEFIGKKLEFRITQFSEGGRNIVVSRRKLLDEQRELMQGAFIEERQIGEIVTGQVKRLEPFGAFVELSPGIEGMVHISELSWSRVAHPQEVVHVGQEVRVKILRKESKEGRLRIALSLRDAGLDPWTLVEQKFPVGKVVQGKMERRESYGLFVQLDDGIVGLLPKSRLSGKSSNLWDQLKKGDPIEVQVAELRVEERRISLALPQQEDGQEDWKEYSSQSSSSSSRSLGTLGDLLKKSMEKQKK